MNLESVKIQTAVDLPFGFDYKRAKVYFYFESYLKRSRLTLITWKILVNLGQRRMLNSEWIESQVWFLYCEHSMFMITLEIYRKKIETHLRSWISSIKIYSENV